MLVCCAQPLRHAQNKVSCYSHSLCLCRYAAFALCAGRAAAWLPLAAVVFVNVTSVRGRTAPTNGKQPTNGRAGVKAH